MENQEVKEGYKLTEVGVIPEDWEVKSLSSLATIQRGASPRPINSPVLYDSTSKVGWVRISDIANSDGKFLKETTDYLSSKGIAQSRFLPAGSLIMSICATVGVPVITKLDSCIHDGFVGFSYLKEINQEFLYYTLKKLESFFRSKSQTGSQSNLNSDLVRSCNIPLPPLHEQEKIAQVLSDFDRAIAQLDKLISKKRNVKQGTMQKLLTGKKRLSGFSGEWEIKELGELAYIQRGASPRPINSPVWYDNTSHVGWVRISDITESNGITLKYTRDYLSNKGIAASRFLPSGSLIMSICATVGVPIITSIDTCIHDGFVGFSNLKGIDKVFLYYKIKELEPSFKLRVQTGSQSNLNTNIVQDYIINLPNYSEQKAIAQVLSDMDTEIEALEKKRNKYQAIKQGMMQELLTGKTRLK